MPALDQHKFEELYPSLAQSQSAAATVRLIRSFSSLRPFTGRRQPD